MKFLEASISMNNKRMDESDVSAPVASPADYIPYFSLALDHLVRHQLTTELPLLLLICLPILRVLNLYNSEITTTTSV